jgi:hypothetical protein
MAIYKTAFREIPSTLARPFFYRLLTQQSAIVPGTGNTARSSHMRGENLLQGKNRATQKSKRSGFHIDTYGL